MSSKAGKRLVPALRFPEFRNSQGWTEGLLKGIAAPVKERGRLDESNRILTLSGEVGIVSQGDYFGKKIAGENTDRYIGIKRNDFVYNDRTTKSFTYGAIKRLFRYEAGLVSPIYKCFRFQDTQNPIFWEWYFESRSHEEQLKKLVNEGARAGRYNISIDSFLSIPVWNPLPPEQDRVADCLSSLDDLITAQTKKIEALKAHKKGLMQQLFPAEGETVPRLRFPEFQGSEEWLEKSVSDFGNVVTGSTPSTVRPEFYGGGIPFVSPADISDLPFVNETRGTLTSLGFNETRPIKANSVLFVCIGSTIGKVAQNKQDCATNQQINSVIPNAVHSGGFVYYALSLNAGRIANLAGKQAVQIINKTQFSAVRLPVPRLKEQGRVADCLSSLDDLITAQTQKFEVLKAHKKGLMQGLFPSISEAEG
jgi:type I restriction enzyme, S subunit